MRHANRLLPATYLTAALCLFTASGCYTERQYGDALGQAKANQTALHEREQRLALLEAENDRLKRQLAEDRVSALSAGFGDDFAGRMSELQARIDGLNRPLKDIERFDVEGGYVLMVQDKILFDSGSADLSADGRKAIAQLAQEISARPHGRIWVRGHTDSDPVAKPATMAKFPRGNLQLSAARALEVATALIDTKSVPARDIAIAGFGQHDPVRANDSSDNKRLNRRVEIFVADQSGARPKEAASGSR